MSRSNDLIQIEINQVVFETVKKLFEEHDKIVHAAMNKEIIKKYIKENNEKAEHVENAANLASLMNIASSIAATAIYRNSYVTKKSIKDLLNVFCSIIYKELTTEKKAH